MKTEIGNARTENRKGEFYEAVNHYRRADVISMLKNGVLSQFAPDEKTGIYKMLAGLRSMEILDILSHQEEPFPAEMLELDFSVSENKNFVKEALEKYKKKFNFSDDRECEKLFMIACESGSRSVIKMLISQNKASNCYVQLGSASIPVFEEVTSLAKNGFDDKDELVKIYFASFLAKDSIDRINYLRKHKMNIFLENSDGYSAADLLDERLKTYKYGGTRNAKYSKIHEEQTLSYLRKLENQEEEQSGKPAFSGRLAAILCVCAVALVVCIGGILYNVYGRSSSDTESSDEAESYSTDTSLAVADGDTVNIDYTGYIDDVAFDGGSTDGAGTDLTIGSGSYIDDFEEQLIGCNVGDTVTVTVTFPEDYGDEDLNGKEAVFEVTINGIYQ